MMDIRLNRSDIRDAERMLLGIKKGVPTATVRALNKTIKGVRTDLVSLIRQDYNYAAKALRARIDLQWASKSFMSAAAVSKGGRIHLSDVTGARPTTKGVMVNVKKSTGRKLIPRAFIRPGKKGKSGKASKERIIYRRSIEGGKMVPREPIEARYAAHPEVIYNNNTMWAKIQAKANDRLNVNFKHEVDAILKGYA